MDTLELGQEMVELNDRIIAINRELGEILPWGTTVDRMPESPLKTQIEALLAEYQVKCARYDALNAQWARS